MDGVLVVLLCADGVTHPVIIAVTTATERAGFGKRENSRCMHKKNRECALYWDLIVLFLSLFSKIIYQNNSKNH